MKKKILLLFSILIFSGFICGSIFYDKLQNNINTSGKLLLREPFENDINLTTPPSWYFVDVSDKSKMSLNIDEGVCAQFMGDTSKILIQNRNGEVLIFDVSTNKLTPIYDFENTGLRYYDISYVDKNHFSIVESDKLILVNFENGNKKIIAEGIGNSVHSWTGDGKTVYYSSKKDNLAKGEICRINIETGKKEVLYDGMCPEISSDGRFLAYEENNRLILRDLQEDTRKVYSGTPEKFCFSPDGKYLAVVEYWFGFGYYDGYSVKIWDYKNNESETILPKYLQGDCWDIDWGTAESKE